MHYYYYTILFSIQSEEERETYSKIDFTHKNKCNTHNGSGKSNNTWYVQKRDRERKLVLSNKRRQIDRSMQ